MRRHWVRSFLPLVLALALVRFSEFPILNADEVTGKSLQVDVLQPVYRQNIYATESMPEIVLRVRLSPPLRQQASSIRGRILDVNQQEMQSQDLAVADLDTVRFAAASLAVGQYTVQVQALDADQQVVAQAQTVIRKLPPAAGSEVRIDQHRNILVNGKPVVLIGWYGTVPLDDPRPDVVALQNVQTPVVVDYPNKEPVAKAFRERGIYSIVSLEPGRLFYSFQLWRKPGNSVAQEWSKLSAPAKNAAGICDRWSSYCATNRGCWAGTSPTNRRSTTSARITWRVSTGPCGNSILTIRWRSRTIRWTGSKSSAIEPATS